MIELIAISVVAVLIGLSLGLLGSGGSILTVPALVYIIGQDEKLAIATSLAIVGFIAATGAYSYHLKKQINWSVVWLFGLPSMFASYFAAGLSTYLSGIVQMGLFAIVMLLASYSMIRKKKNKVVAKDIENAGIKIGAYGVFVGCVTGLVGVGGGFLIVPALVLFTRLSMSHAVATSLVIITMQSFSGFIKYHAIMTQQQLSLDWNIIFMVAAIGAMGSIAGQKISTKIPQESLKRFFGFFLLIMGIFILAKSIISLNI